VRQLQLELNSIEEQAKLEVKKPETHDLGVLRKDLVEECRRRLIFITYMVKDEEEQANERCQDDERNH
jgi:hypothetical protein